jgi:hypothetical protein
LIQSAASNDAVVDALADEARETQYGDQSRALVALSILGETRSPRAIKHLRTVLWQALPTTGTIVDGEIAERVALEILEAKAVSGLAYSKDPIAEQEVLRAVSEHPSHHVRAEAAAVYRANHSDTAEVRELLMKRVRKGEERFVDRPIRSPGESKESVNKKLSEYMSAHPEIVPPAPIQLPPSEKKAHVEPAPDPLPTR